MVLVRIEREIEIPDNFIEDAIIDPAGYGIAYWANLAEIDSEARTYTVKDQFGDYDAKVISYDKLAQVLADFAFRSEKWGIAPDSDWVTWAREAIFELETGEDFPGGTLDSDITDAIVQIAAFGELVYG
jgi:hypothetical protein